MAMKEVWTHPKFKALKMRLNLDDWEAVGLLEAVWGICSQVKACRNGEIPWPETRIAAYIGWRRGDPADMIAGLVECGWLDTASTGWKIHDWHQHAPRWVLGILERERMKSAAADSVRDSVRNSVADSVPHSAGMGMGKGAFGDRGVGEGAILWPKESLVKRWPTEAGFCREVVEAQHRAVSAMLTVLPAEEVSFAWGGLCQEWGSKGVRPADALKTLLADMSGVRSPLKVIRHRLAGAGLALETVSGSEAQFDTTKNGTRRRAS